MRKNILIGLLLTASLASCQKDDIDAPVELRLSTALEVEMEADTRSPLSQASGNFKANKNVGVFIIENSTLTTGKTLYNNSNCIATTTSVTDNKTYLNFATGVHYYWPSSGYGLKLYGWYPLATVPENTANNLKTLVHTIKADQSNVGNYEDSDLMFGSNTVSRTTGFVDSFTANIPFNHKLTRIQVVLKNGQGLTQTDLNGSEVYIGDNTGYLKNSVTLTDLLAGTVTVRDNKMTEALKLCTSYNSTDNNNAYAVIPPQNLNDIWLYVKLPAAKGSGILKVKLTHDLSAGAGKAYKFTVTVSLTELKLTASITDWTDGGNNNVEAKFD